MVVARGEIWWADLGEPRGSEPGYRRPVLVISSDAFNRSQIGTVIVAAVTSNVALAHAPGNVRLTAREARLSRESVVNVSQLLTLDRTLLMEKAGRLPASKLTDVDAGLRLSLSLGRGK
jgi:mRNA interferase MazF